MVEPVKTVIPETTPTRLTFFQKVLLKKALKKVEPDKNKMTNGELFATVLGIGFIVAGLLLTSVTLKITFLVVGMIFTLWVLFQLLKKL